MKQLIVFVAILLPACVTWAAEPTRATIHIGDGTIDGRILQVYDNVWAVNIVYTDGRRDERGLSSDHVRFREIDGKLFLTRTEGTTAVIGKPGERPSADFSMTFNVFDPVTMAPLLGSAASSDHEDELHEFSGRHVTTTTHTAASGADVTKSSIDLPEPVYDFNGGMTGLLLAALPLKVGYRAVLPALGEHGFETAEIRVIREETTSAGRLGPRKAFVVEIGPEPTRSTYWISNAAPYVIRAEVRAPNAVATWDML